MRTKIRRRSTRAGVRWYLSVVDDAGTETAHGGFATQREAKAAAAGLVADERRGRYVKPAGLTVEQYLVGEWLPSRENADLSPTTRDIDRTTVAAWIAPHIGDVPLQKLSARDLDSLYRVLRERGGRGGKPLRGKSVRNVHVTLSKVLGDAVRRGHIAVSPVAAVDPPAKDDSVERKAWTAEDASRFLEHARGDRLGAIWRLALSTGARRGELLGIQWEDIDLETCTVTIRRQVLVHPRAVAGQPRVFVRNTTKARRYRAVRFDAATAAALRSWKAAQGRDRLAFGAAWKSDGGLGVEAAWVVTEPDGAVVHPETMLARWHAVGKQAGVPMIPVHGGRHAYATLSLEAGTRLDIVAAQLGHASVSTTADIYSHVSPAAAQDAADRLGSILEGGG